MPGWKIVMPSNPLDAYGLMLSAIVDPNPVMFLAPKALLRAKAGQGERIPGEPDDDRELSQDDRRAARRPVAAGGPSGRT